MELDIYKLAKKDVFDASASLTDAEARFLVDFYYIAQEDRKRANNQTSAMKKDKEPVALLGFLTEQAGNLEEIARNALDRYTAEHLMGGWMRQIFGIGPVLSAGLLAHIDIEKAPTVGHIWRFAGLDPTVKWEKGQKRPFNATLKVICWKIGQSFMKFSGYPKCVYGHFYRQRKEYENKRNEAMVNMDLALELAEKVKKDTDAYQYLKEGFLPPGQIDARARRWAVKLFLSHLHGEWYKAHFKKEPPLPYPLAHLNHVHFIPSPVKSQAGLPAWEMPDDIEEAPFPLPPEKPPARLSKEERAKITVIKTVEEKLKELQARSNTATFNPNLSTLGLPIPAKKPSPILPTTRQIVSVPAKEVLPTQRVSVLTEEVQSTQVVSVPAKEIPSAPTKEEVFKKPAKKAPSEPVKEEASKKPIEPEPAKLSRSEKMKAMWAETRRLNQLYGSNNHA